MATKGASNRYGNTKNGRMGRITQNTGYAWAKEFNKLTLQRHFKDHGQQVGCPTKESYAANAVLFANTVNRDRYVTYLKSNGKTVKYDRVSGRFASVTKHGIVLTYFKPKNGFSYFLNEIECDND